MGFPLNLQATPDINTPGLISDTGGDDRQNDGARQLLAQEFGQRGAPGQKVGETEQKVSATEQTSFSPGQKAGSADVSIIGPDAAKPVTVVADNGQQDAPDPMMDPKKTWEEKYEAVEGYIRDHYYPKDRLQASNFYDLDKKYVGHIKTEADYIAAIKAETSTLKDPWTEYKTDAEIKQMDQTTDAGRRFAGIWTKQSGNDIVIEALLWGFPAYKSNLKIGDKLTSVDGKSVAGMTSDQVDALLQGKLGQSIKIGYETPEGDKKVESLPLVNKQEMHSSAQIVEDPKTGKNVLQLGLLSFDREADDELEDAIKAIPKDKLNTVSGVVLDMRGNQGGMIPPITRTADMFVPPGDLFRIDSRDGSDMIQTQGFEEKDYTLDADTRTMLRSLPMAILVNGTTRSAPETLTASLRERGRPCAVVGEKTYGKSIAFDTVDVPDGQLKLTIEELKTPSGFGWHGKGLQPDIVVANKRGQNAADDQLTAAIDAVIANKK